jgi:steroid 5-alpha reductase family enzyme
MMTRNYSKASSMAIMTLIYGIAIGVGCLTFDKASAAMPEIWALLLSDVVATIFVWGMGLVYKNVSVYDPYWSVAPPVMFTAWAFCKGCWTLPVILLLVAVWYWGIRLTGNWARTFKGLGHEDWRYTRYRETLSPFLFQITNFFGLNMMPTVLVFACMLPGFGLFEADSANWLTWLGFALCLASATIQLIADTQIHRFRESHPKQFCNAGLWKHGRHPNYFGEIQMWWGVWVMYASLNGINWYILAPVAMTCLFLFVSIPMMERRQLGNKPGYADYRKRTRILI